MPRFRFTIRLMMVVVAIVAIATGWLVNRANRFRRMSVDYQGRIIWLYEGPTTRLRRGSGFATDPQGWIVSPVRNQWYQSMAAKYAQAARYPWRPVEPDPPMPD